MRLLLASSLALALSTVFAAPALAEWPSQSFLVDLQRTAQGSVIFEDGLGGHVLGFVAPSHGGGNEMLLARILPDGSSPTGFSTGDNRIGLYVSHAAAPDQAGGIYHVYGSGDLRLRHLGPSGADPAWPIGGLPVVTTPSNEWLPKLAPDGAHGVFLAYSTTTGAMFVKHVLATAQIDPLWPAGGFSVASSGAVALVPGLFPDGAGGVLIVWANNDDQKIRAQRLTSTGAIAFGWPAAGLVLASLDAAYQYPSKLLDIVPSGPDTMIAGWTATSNVGSTTAVWLQRFSIDGHLAPGWPVAGRKCERPGSTSFQGNMVSDGIDGVWAVWSEDCAVIGSRVRANGTVAVDAATLTPASIPNCWGTTPAAVTASIDRGIIITWTEQPTLNNLVGHALWLRDDGTPLPWESPTGTLFYQAPTDPGYGPIAENLIGDHQGGAFALWSNPSARTGAIRLPFPVSPAGVRPWSPPGALSLAAPSPNPARDAIDVRFTLAGSGGASLELVDLAGRRVRGLAVEGAGAQSARFDHLSELPAGVYFVRLAQGNLKRKARVVVVH